MLFSSKVLPYLVVASFVASTVTGDVVEHLCCDDKKKCTSGLSGPPPPPPPLDSSDPNPPPFGGEGCQYFYEDPFPNTIGELQQLCADKPDGMTKSCIDISTIQKAGGQIKADYWCCAQCPDPAHHTSIEADAMLSDCDYFFGQGHINNVEDACQHFVPVGGLAIPGSKSGSETCKVIAAVFGGWDPHFKTWGGEWYDYHGMCDLVMLDVPDFGNGQGLTIHIRTKIRYNYSFIESAAIKIEDDIFQLSSYGDYVLNGVSQAKLPTAIGGYPIRQVKANTEKETHFEIVLSEHKSIELSTWKDLVNVRIPALNHQELRTSKGLFGSFPSGALVGRDGTTIFTDHNEFGQEWQVLETEPKLFAVVDNFPQLPHHQCVLPDPTKDARHRRLGEAITRETAAEACSHWHSSVQELCVKDVIATGDIEIAQSNHHMMV